MGRKLVGETRTKYAIKNIFWGLLSKIIILIFTFINRTLFIYLLPVEYLGINSLFAEVLSLVSVVDLGLGTAMAYSYYEPLAKRDEKKLAALTQFYGYIYRIVSMVFAILGVILIPFVRYIVDTEIDIPYLEFYYFIHLVNAIISYLFAHRSTLVAADQKSYLLSRYTIKINFAKIICQIIFLYYTRSYFVYVTLTAIFTLFVNILIYFKTNELYPYIKERTRLKKQKVKEISADIKALFLYKCSSVIMNNTDNILISVLVGTVTVGVYSNYNLIVYHLASISNLFYNAITASIGNRIAEEGPESNLALFKVLQMISFWISGVFVVCTFALSQPFIELWLGESFLLSNATLIAIVLNFYLTLTMPHVWSFREAVGMFKKANYAMFAAALLNILFSLILGWKWGIFGIIIASFIAKVTTFFWYEPTLLYKEYFKCSYKRYFAEHLINMGLILSIIILFTIVFQEYNVNGWLQLIIKTIVLMVTVNLIYFVRYCRTEEFVWLLEKIRTIRKY